MKAILNPISLALVAFFLKINLPSFFVYYLLNDKYLIELMTPLKFLTITSLFCDVFYGYLNLHEASVLIDTPHDEAEVASTLGIHEIELVRCVLVAVIQGMDLDNGISDGSLESIGDVGLNKLDVGGEGVTHELWVRLLRDVNAAALCRIEGFAESNGIVAGNSSD